MPFGPSRWTRRTNVPAMVQSPGYGVMFDDKVFVLSAQNFIDGGNPNVYRQHMALSTDKGITWHIQDLDNVGEGIFNVGSTVFNGQRSYFRLKRKFARSFFLANNELFPGYIDVQYSLDGSDWVTSQRLYSWSHRPNTGSPPTQASQNIHGYFRFIPGSGPNGADADWLIIKVQVIGGGGTVFDEVAWWRSDDAGLTWVFDRLATPALSELPAWLERGRFTNRLVAGVGAGMTTSDDNGLTWQASGGSFFGLKSQGFEQAGQTWLVYSPGSLGGPGATGISCDNAATFVGNQPIATTNSNIIGLRLNGSESLAFVRDLEVGATGQIIWYSSNGGELYVNQGVGLIADGWPQFQAGIVVVGLCNDGAPFVVGVNSASLLGLDKAQGVITPRSICPLAFADMVKAGIPPLCGHPMLQTSCT